MRVLIATAGGRGDVAPFTALGAAASLVTLGDKGYHGAGDHILTPCKGKNKPASQKDANRAHAKLRGPGERANAQLKSWRILRKLRCYSMEGRTTGQSHPHRSGAPAQRMKRSVYLYLLIFLLVGG